MDQIVLCSCYIFKKNLESRTYYFITRKSASKEMEHIKERISEFGAFKEEVGMNKKICNKIQTSI